MINLDEYDKCIMTTTKGTMEGVIKKDTNHFYDKNEFIDLLINSHRDCEKKIEGLRIQSERREEDIENLRKDLKQAERNLDQDQSSYFNKGKQSGVQEICNIIQERMSLFQGEAAVHDLYMAYSDIVDMLRNRGLWKE